MSEYHVPVMLAECLEGLHLKPGGVYVDVTFGGGGHSRAILERLEGGKLFGFDQDDDAQANAAAIDDKRFTLIAANFRHVRRYLKLYGITQLDGLLADLGVSSHQIDAAERGFSTRFDGPLDMRMDRNGRLTAADVVNNYPEAELHRILGMYGEVTNARSLAAALVRERITAPIQSIGHLKQVAGKLAPRSRENKYLAQVFQALRIEVNEELKALEEMLTASAQVLRPGGRLVVMAYHSLEDRLVKNFINKGLFQGEPEKDVFGNFETPFRAITRKPVTATAEEIERNPRSRSAKLRVGEKV